MRSLALISFLLLSLTLSGTAFSGTELFNGLSGELRVIGSDVGLAAAREAADRIMSANPAVRISFAVTGAGAGIRRLRLHQADLCLYDREPRTSGQPGTLTYVAYGVDPVVIAVNPVNTVGPLTAEQVRQLFSAKIRLWSEVGGGEISVLPIYVEASEEEGRPNVIPGNYSVSSQPAMRFTLARNKEAMGLISMRDLDAYYKPITVDGATPDLASFKAGRYKIYRIMYAAMGTSPAPLAKAFMEYLTGPEGQAILEKTGYVPLASKPQWESVLPVGNPDRLAQGY